MYQQRPRRGYGDPYCCGMDNCNEMDDCCAGWMVCCGARAMLCTLVILLTVAGIIAYVGFNTPWMASYEVGGLTFHFGIFTFCGQVDTLIFSSASCGSLLNADGLNEDWWEGAQATAIIAGIASFVAWSLTISWICCLHYRSNMCIKLWVIILLCIAVVMYIVSISLFSANWDDNGRGEFFDLDWAFYFAWIAVALFLACAIFALFVPASGDYMEPQMAYAYGQPVGHHMQPQPYQQQPVVIQTMQVPQQQAYSMPMKQYPQSTVYSQGYGNPSAGYPNYGQNAYRSY